MALASSQTLEQIALPTPRESYDYQNEKQFRQALERLVTRLSTVPDPARPWLYASDYGVVGNGTVDDTAAMQAALDAGGVQKRPVYAANMVVMISSGLTLSGPGLIFDQCSFGAPNDPGIYVTGSGYTALTVAPSPGTLLGEMRVCVYGTGNTANGIFFNNPAGWLIPHIRVFNLNGFGVHFSKVWDCVVLSVSVEQCTDSSQYAFQITGDGDTSNMSHFEHIQVESCGGRTIYIDDSTLSCIFDDIHSEGTTPIAGVETWHLGGASCHFRDVRISPNAPSADATLRLSGEDNIYEAFRVEHQTVTECTANAGTSHTIINPNVYTLKMVLGQTGIINVLGGIATSLLSDPGFRVTGMTIATLSCGFTANPPDPTMEYFERCKIATLTSTSTLSAATFVDCAIAECGNLLQGATVLVRTTVAAASRINLGTAGSGKLIAIHSTITGNLQYNNTAPIRTTRSVFTGTITSDGGNRDLLFDAHTTVGAGTATADVAQPTGGAHVVGDRHYNPLPSVGGNSFWSCTAAGTPGTFTLEGTTGGGASSSATSTADSKAVSSGARASTADSDALSSATRASVADSKAVSDGSHCSIVDSRLTSAGF